MNHFKLILLVSLTFVFISGCGDKESIKKHDHNSHKHGNSMEKGTKEEAKLILYPLDYCVVSDEELGSMGDPISIEHKDQEIKLCCKGCVKTFHKNPELYLGKIRKATSWRAPNSVKKEQNHKVHDHSSHGH